MQKRLGTALWKLKKTWGKKMLQDGKTIGGRGRLTGKLMDKLHGYYGKAIRESHGSVDAMEKAVHAVLYHRASSDRKPMHENTVQKEQIAGVGGKEIANPTNITIPFLQQFSRRN